ncbi:MAG: DNA polymerase, partial [Terriglobales bacterium]
MAPALPDAATGRSPRFPSPALYLLDTMGYIFRAFHALPPLTNSKGQPTQAVLGVVNMVRKLVQEARPTALAAVFDLAGPTFRDRDFADYKANRAPMPETLVPQLPYIRRALEALRVPILECEGFEADDVIGTLARQAAAAGGQVVIVSSDKDLLQMVDGGIWVYNPGRDELMDAVAVEAKLGVKPAQVADLLALRGDAVDNIPGAPGIGEKGAQQIIQRFGSVEAAMARAAEVERKSYRESLQNHAEQIRLSKALATIHTEAPLTYDSDAWRRQEPDVEACRVLFTELEFHHLLRGLAESSGTAPVTAEPVLETEADATAVQALLHRHPHGPLALSWRADDSHVGLADADSVLAIPLHLAGGLTTALRDTQRHWQWLDSKAARAQMRKQGQPLPELVPERVDDVGLLAYLDDPTRGSFTFTPAPLSAAAEAGAVASVAGALRERVAASGQLSVYADLDLPLVPVLEVMERTGVRLDPAPLAELSLELERRALAAQEQVFEHAGTRFNLNSPAQLAEILFTRLGLPAPARRGKTKTPSTAVDVLEELIAYPVIPPILEYRQLTKLKSTYVDALPPLLDPGTRRLHTTYV